MQEIDENYNDSSEGFDELTGFSCMTFKHNADKYLYVYNCAFFFDNTHQYSNIFFSEAPVKLIVNSIAQSPLINGKRETAKTEARQFFSILLDNEVKHVFLLL